MALKDISTAASPGTGTYQPASPFEPRVVQIDFSKTPVVHGTDQVNLIPMNVGEYVHQALVRVDVAAGTAATFVITDTRTGAGGAGAVLAGTALNGAVGSVTAAAGASLTPANGAAATTSGFLQGSNSHASADLLVGKATVYALIGKLF